MNKKKLWRIIWIISIYALLISILYLVILYKTKWEGKDLNTYLYFYDCGDSICTSTHKPKVTYNKMKCENEECPFIDNINKNIVILNNEKKSWIYDYKKNEIINNQYNEYKYISNNNYIIKNNSGKYGVISINQKNKIDLLVEDIYDKIIDYKDNCLLYIKDGKYKIKNIKDKKLININNSSQNIQLINDKYYYYQENNKYKINEYNTNKPVNENLYNYIFAIDNIILTINNKSIDILNNNTLESTLLLKIPTYFKYSNNNEIKSLNIKVNHDILYFTVILDDKKYQNYRYDLKTNKML